MDAIETETVELAGHTFRITICPDSDAPNPLEDVSEMGTILSLNRRHANFDACGVEAALESNADSVPLSHYEHGLCLWSVAGELPATCRCRFDSVPMAGVWLPDAETLASAAPLRGLSRRHFMRTRARQACAVFTQWCNGEVYGFIIERLTDCPAGGTHAEHIHSCWGLYGLEECQAEARANLIGRGSLLW